MALSNRERQALYRERLKARAAMGDLSPDKVEVLAGIRRHVREWKNSIALIEAGVIGVRWGDNDAGPDHVRMLRRLIEQNEQLLAKMDPDDLSADGHIEMGQVSAQVAGQLWKGRAVTFGYDDAGRACDVSAHDSVHQANLVAGGRPDRHVGAIADDGWSIVQAWLQEPGEQ